MKQWSQVAVQRIKTSYIIIKKKVLQVSIDDDDVAARLNLSITDTSSSLRADDPRAG